MRATVALAVALLTVVAGCKQDPKPGAAPPPPANLTPDAAVAADSGVAERAAWKDALAEPDDALLLARLAEAEGAAGLLVGLEEGGAVGNVALLALPYADDAEHAMGRLAEILEASPPESMALVIDAMEGITLRPLTQTEPADPLGVHRAFDALARTSSRKDLPAHVRARAVSVARLLASRRPFDARALPTEFDR
ncbi:MAG: thiamine biosynthesis protein [Polyangiaceae bacterium]|nr:thiamine biosynthesis protein [Polyangiaceae bacterium]